MRRRIVVVSAVLSLPALLAGAGFFHQPSREAAPDAASAAVSNPDQLQVQTIDGSTVLTVPVAMQQAGGLALALARAQQGAAWSSVQAYASVMDILPLLDGGNKLAAATAEREAARAQAEAVKMQAARMQTLFQDDQNVSRKAQQEAAAAAQAGQARLMAADAVLAGVASAIRLQYGDVVAHAAAAPGGGLWRELASGQASLLRVTFPEPGRAAPDSVTVEAPDGAVLKARKLSASPQVDPMVQGAAWLYLVTPALPSGLRTQAHAAGPARQANQRGVLVPESAIVWYGDLRWVYVRTEKTRFTRRLVQVAAQSADGVVVTAGVAAGDEVLTRGAALLLSEEQRPRGIATQCKDPPECDD